MHFGGTTPAFSDPPRPAPAAERAAITGVLQEQDLFPVFLSQADVAGFYEGFSNKTIWPGRTCGRTAATVERLPRVGGCVVGGPG